jgi:hypothetical protein
MNRTKLIRSLRIGWSALFGLLAVLLCVLWVRSYWRHDTLHGWKSNKVVFSIGSEIGVIGFMWDQRPARYTWRARLADGGDIPLFSNSRTTTGETMMNFPIWLPIILLCSIGAVPWLPYRFSLRTLLVATTLVAVVLGLIVWAARK